jgi:uncharacterized protein (TIGR02145 family)
MKSLYILTIIGYSIISLPVFLQTSDQTTRQEQKRIALVIGNGNYLLGSLANPENDARAMKNALQNVGFDVIEYENLNQGEMKRAIDEFGEKIKSYDVGLFYFAGHGIQSNGYNYLIPVDAQLTTEKQIEYDCVQADRVLALMEGSGAKINIIILDACRNNPFERSWTRTATGKGLAFMDAPEGTLIAYATSPGKTASDGSGLNGLYTSAILESIQLQEINIIQMFQNVRKIVVQKSNKQQTPWESTSLTGDFYFSYSGDSTMMEVSKDYIKDVNMNEGVELPTEISGESSNKGEFVDARDGKKYKWVRIGNQIWMAENLAFLPKVDHPDVSFGGGFYVNQYLGTNVKLAKITENYAIYGVLYTWYSAMNGDESSSANHSLVQGVCPDGWHLPSFNEWKQLLIFIGMSQEEADKKQSFNNDVGGKLKEAGYEHWQWPNTGATNESGFTALPGGYISDQTRENHWLMGDVGPRGGWWSSTSFRNKNAWLIGLESGEARAINFVPRKRDVFSVRCVKDN